jgi:hypothetical protein
MNGGEKNLPQTLLETLQEFLILFYQKYDDALLVFLYVVSITYVQSAITK